MKTSRINAIVVATLAFAAAGTAHAQNAPGSGSGAGTGSGAVSTGGATVRLDTVQKIWVMGDDLGPKNNGTPVVGKNTGAGIMDANFIIDSTTAAKAKYGEEVLLGTTYTRSSLTPNNNNSYMQGGFAIAKLTPDGVQLGQSVDLPKLNGERAYMRPLIAFSPKYAVLIAASEDNESNNGNPKPVLYLADKSTGQLVDVPNNPRRNSARQGGRAPLDLINLAVRSGIAVQNPDNQRGPHMIVPINDRSFLVGMQYNNQAQEVFRVTVQDDASVEMDWVQRYSNNAVHNRPQVAYNPGEPTAYMTAIECNAQPANIGIRLTELDVNTGKPTQSKIVVRAQPNQNKYVAESSITLVDSLSTGMPSAVAAPKALAIQWSYTAKARERNGNNGHAANGSNVTQLALFGKTDLNMIGDPLVAPANYQRHAHIFGTAYGPNGDPAVGVISGSSTGTAGALLQVIPLKADGSLGVKDPLKMYKVSTYSDVANLQARGKRNPNNQAKGFVNGVGMVPNPGYEKPGKFYSEVKYFTFSTVTGYSSDQAKTVGKRESLYLSLVPSVWKPGLQTAPGTPSDTAGTAPAPTTTGPATTPGGGDVSPGSGDSVTNGDATNPGDVGAGSDRSGEGDSRTMGESNGGCSVSTSSTSSNGAGLLVLAVAGAFLAVRRRKAEEK